MDAAPAKGLELWAALAEDGLASEVKRGENAGRTLAHAAVVRTAGDAARSQGRRRVASSRRPG